MFKIFQFSLFFFVLVTSANAQIPAEVFVGHKQTQHEFFFFKDIDTAGKFSLFSMARFALNYEDKNQNNSFVSSQVTYKLTKNWGISTGANYVEKEFSPIIAISYSYLNKKGDFSMNLFPTMTIKENPNYELFGLIFYTPKLTEKWNFFSQLIFGSGLNNKFNEHTSSSQQLRLGLGYKNQFQFGVGIDQAQIGSFKNLYYSNNIGVFIRKEL